MRENTNLLSPRCWLSVKGLQIDLALIVIRLAMQACGRLVCVPREPMFLIVSRKRLSCKLFEQLINKPQAEGARWANASSLECLDLYFIRMVLVVVEGCILQRRSQALYAWARSRYASAIEDIELLDWLLYLVSAGVNPSRALREQGEVVVSSTSALVKGESDQETANTLIK